MIATTLSRSLLAIFTCSTVALATACGGSSDASSADGAGPASAAAGAGGMAGSSNTNGTGGTSFGTGGGFASGGAATTVTPTGEVAEVFAHGPGELYRLDPDTKALTTVGPFVGCYSVTDIALDKESQMYGVSESQVYLIDKNTAKCTLLAEAIGYPNSLSFVPKGTVDPNEEALVGYVQSSYVRIDKKTGAMTTIGDLNAPYVSSGDVVSVIDGGTYLTVHEPGCNGSNCMDSLVEVDPKTGAIKKMVGPVGHAQVFGLAFWAGLAYGFDSAGELFEVDVTNGKTTPIPIPGMPPAQFWGAGSTTSAPPVAVIK